MAVAARTAPKGCGVDNIWTAIIDGEDKKKLTDAMRDFAKNNEGADYFERDANNVDGSTCIVLIGVHNSPIGLTNCGFCGFENCAECKKAGANCNFNITDVGIAVSSAVSIAADNRIDNRIMFTAGKLAMQIGLFPEDVKVGYGIPLSASGKNRFFDRG
jgi:uncharacterized ferredoxin-like protein